MTSYCLWRVIASLVPDMSKVFREAHYELARLTQVRTHDRSAHVTGRETNTFDP